MYNKIMWHIYIYIMCVVMMMYTMWGPKIAKLAMVYGTYN